MTNMIDHLGMPVIDIARATEFYLAALRPLGYGVVIEVAAEDTGRSDNEHAHGQISTFGAASRVSSGAACMSRASQGASAPSWAHQNSKPALRAYCSSMSRSPMWK